jgi:hypothetical protein
MTVDESNGFFAARRFNDIAAICVEIIDYRGVALCLKLLLHAG